MNQSISLDWYFDFISPFAYLQYQALGLLQRDRPDLQVRYKPVLFAALLQHHSHKGPAEIPSKRSMTYRYCNWYARRHGIPFRVPAAHPFNPIPVLRLAIAHDCKPPVLARLFNHIWVESADDQDFSSLDALSRIPEFKSAEEETSQPEVKNKLRALTNEAIERGVFGVPTIAINDMLFWGLDMTEMAIEYLDHPGQFEQAEYRRIERLPVAQARI